MSIPGTDLTVTGSVREGIRLIMFGVPCPTCGQGRPRMTQVEVAKASGVSTATLSRFLGGKPISSDHLDVLYEWVNRHLPEVPR